MSIRRWRRCRRCEGSLAYELNEDRAHGLHAGAVRGPGADSDRRAAHGGGAAHRRVRAGPGRRRGGQGRLAAAPCDRGEAGAHPRWPPADPRRPIRGSEGRDSRVLHYRGLKRGGGDRDRISLPERGVRFGRGPPDRADGVNEFLLAGTQPPRPSSGELALAGAAHRVVTAAAWYGWMRRLGLLLSYC